MAVGKIGQFDLEKDNWDSYVDRLDQYFIANDVKNEKKVAILITVIGNDAYELMISLCTPDKPATKTYTELVALMKSHLNPKPSLLAERFKYRQRIQKQGESIAIYVSELKRLSKDCGFTADSLKENLRDQFVCGLVNDSIRQKLFTEDDNITFEKAYKLALSIEAAEANAALVEGCTRGKNGNSMLATTDTAVHRVGVDGGAGGQRAASGRSAAGGRRGRDSARASSGPSDKNGAGSEKYRPSGYRAPERNQNNDNVDCKVCGGRHSSHTCKFKLYVCRICNQEGHLKKMCPRWGRNNFVHTMNVQEQAGVMDKDSESDEVFININRLSVGQCKPIIVSLKVNGHNLDMECDTGSAISCISYELYKKLFSNLPIEPCKLVLRYYTGELVRPLGMIKSIVHYKDTEKLLDLYIIENGNTTLLGRQWLAEMNISVSALQYSSQGRSCEDSPNDVKFKEEEFSSRFCEVFAEGLGRFTGGPVSIHVREGARPVFLRARPLAYALREPVERALDQLVCDDILTPVDCSEWATPIVPVVKKDGTIRLCADFKLTLNKVIDVDRYPIPKVEDLLARLHGGQKFSKIDLSQAYAQLDLDETSRKYTVINTHKGLFMYKRLVYGLSSSPGIFQRRLEQLFADLPYVGVFLDDIIITGIDTAQHLSNLNKVFERLKSSGLKVKKEKCSFFAESLNYLGHTISKEGVHTCPEKVRAIVETPAPTNVSELRAFIGMVMYYGKFIKNVSAILTPLYNLLRTGVKYVWKEHCQAAFERVKRALCSSEVLMHYSLEMPLVLTADASAAGVGAVISHLTPDGERPIAYASRTLTAAEKSYAQIDREALAIIYGVRKFHQYLYGRKFLLRTDHKPLTYIFGNKVGIPVMAASRLQRWAILLSGYTYDIEYVTSAQNCADALSRLPQQTKKIPRVDEFTYLNFVEDFLPVTNNEVRVATSQDPLLSRVMVYIQSGWPRHCEEETLKPYFARRCELYVERGCIMWGYRIVIPFTLRATILKQLHIGHMGIVKTKSLGRSFVWWPKVDTEIEATCRQCSTCALEAPAPPRAAPRPWPYLAQPWSRIHMDFLGPFQGKTFFVVVDSTSKWIEIVEMSQTKAVSVIKVLRSLFARFGLPIEVVSDQGPPFTSAELTEFLIHNGIKQSFSPIHHPASNGAAENAVKLCKRAIKKAMRDAVDVDTALQTYLLAYRNSPHSTTGESPAMLLQRRPLRSRWDLLRSDYARRDQVERAQHRQSSLGATPKAHVTGDQVWARNYGIGDKWIQGTVRSKEGSRRYVINSDDGRHLTRHVDQIRRKSLRSSLIYPDTSTELGGSEDVVRRLVPGVTAAEGVSGVESGEVAEREPVLREVEERTDCPLPAQPPPPPLPVRELRTPPSRSGRVRKPPVRYGWDID